MKKIKFIALGVLAFITIASTVFISCRKQQKTITTYSNNTIQSDLKKISEKYTFKNVGFFKMTEGEKRLVAGGADIAAAAEYASATWGLSVFPVLGFANGVACGVVAAAASVAAYNACGMVVRTSGGSAPNPTGNYDVPNPHNNPYEFIGIRHNQLVDVYYSGNMNQRLNSNTSIFNSTQLNSSELQVLPVLPNKLTVSINNYISSNPITTATGIKPFLDHFFINNDELQAKEIILTFYNELKGIHSLSQTMSFINEYEIYFINCNTITPKEKEILLTCFAVAKHSFSLWDEVIAQ
jgi:hypothetical protein